MAGEDQAGPSLLDEGDALPAMVGKGPPSPSGLRAGLDCNTRRHTGNLRARTWPPFLRFGLVGLVNAAFGYTMFALFVLSGIWPGVALVGATIAGVAFNFQTSRLLVFRSAGSGLRFVAVYMVVLALNWLALRALQWCGLPDLGSQAILTLPAAALSFAGQSIFVFRFDGARI